MTQLLLTAVGADRAGLVSDLSEIVVNYDGNWLDSRMARLAGAFAGIVLIDIESSEVETLKVDLGGLEAKGLRVTVTDTTPQQDEGQAVLVVHLIGYDHPGWPALHARPPRATFAHEPLRNSTGRPSVLCQP